MYNLVLLLICISFIVLCIKKKTKMVYVTVVAIRDIFLAYSFLIFFFIIHAFVTHFDGPTFLDNIRVATYTILPLILLILDDKIIPKINELILVIVILIILQLLWCLLELNGIYPYLVFYTPGYEGISENLMPGTFPRFNAMTNFLTTIFLFLSIDYYLRKKIPLWIYSFIAVVVFVSILMSGSRMSLFLYAFVFFSTILLYNRNKVQVLCVLTLFVIVACFAVGSGFLSDNEGFERIVEGFTQFFNKKGETTASLSSYLIDNYFYNSPLWGNGLSWKGEYAYGDIDGNYKADARLAFVLVEFGIIGLLLFLFYFVKIFNATKRIVPITMKKSLLLVFVYFSIFTFTESGFFDLHCIPYLFIYYFSVKRFYNEHSDCTNVANK